LGGYFGSSKCPGPAVANFELMINSLMINRVKYPGPMEVTGGALLSSNSRKKSGIIFWKNHNPGNTDLRSMINI